MLRDKNEDRQKEDKPDAGEQRINLSDYAGDEEDYKIAADQANTYREDCERAIGTDKTTIRKDSFEGE